MTAVAQNFRLIVFDQTKCSNCGKKSRNTEKKGDLKLCPPCVYAETSVTPNRAQDGYGFDASSFCCVTCIRCVFPSRHKLEYGRYHLPASREVGYCIKRILLFRVSFQCVDFSAQRSQAELRGLYIEQNPEVSTLIKALWPPGDFVVDKS